MNWNLIVRLSFFGFLMGAATVSLVPTIAEPVFWLIIYVISAYAIARKCTSNYFLNGFMLTLLNSAWVTGFHVIFYRIYLSSHPDIDLMYSGLPFSDSPRLGIIVIAPVLGSFFGVILGFFSFIASKVVRKQTPD